MINDGFVTIDGQEFEIRDFDDEFVELVTEDHGVIRVSLEEFKGLIK